MGSPIPQTMTLSGIVLTKVPHPNPDKLGMNFDVQSENILMQILYKKLFQSFGFDLGRTEIGLGLERHCKGNWLLLVLLFSWKM